MARFTLSPKAVSRSLRNARSLVGGGVRYVRALATVTEVIQLYQWAYLKSRFQSSELAEQNMHLTHEKAGTAVRKLCEANGAIWVKMAQFFSCRPDVLPKEYIEQLQVLQNEAPDVPFSAIERVLVEAMGDQWRDNFLSFDTEPVATASIAQVHKATLKSGEEVAVKIQLPEVRDLFWQDVAKFKFIANVVSPFIKELDVAQVTEQMIRTTMGELNFNLEVKNLQHFASFDHLPRIKVPDVYLPFCSEKVMVTSWVPGYRLRDYLDANPAEAADLLTLLMHSYVQQVTVYGAYHGDPHPGNFLVNDKKEITIIDFGVVATLTQQEVANYTELLFALVGGESDLDRLQQLFNKAGFKGGTAETLKALADYVVSDKLNKLDLTEAMDDLLGRFRDQRIQIPDSYVSMARVLITVGGFLLHYGVPFELPMVMPAVAAMAAAKKPAVEPA